MKVLALASAALLLLPSAHAQSFPKFYVYGEEDSDFESCGISLASAVSAVQATLRHNRIEIGTRDDAVRSEALQLYVDMNFMPIAGGCAGSMVVSMQSSQPTLIVPTGKTQVAVVELCRHGALISGQTYNMQSRINDSVEDFTNQCLTEYADSNK